MKREDLELLERKLLEEIAKRRQLGGYSTDAFALLMLAEVTYEIVRHLQEQLPRSK
jgi:hypothetical protein